MLRTFSSLLVAAGLGAGVLAFGGVATAATATCPPPLYGHADTCVIPATAPLASTAPALATAPLASTAPVVAAAPVVATAPLVSTDPTTVAASTLPFTGADVAGTAGGGAAAIILGAGLVRLARRRRS